MSQTDPPSKTEPSLLGTRDDVGHLEDLPWTGITVVIAVLGLLFFMAVPMRKPTAREMLLAQREHGASLACETLGRAIQDYHAEHSEWPGVRPNVASTLGPPEYGENHLCRQLEMPSDRLGFTMPTGGGQYTYGPYLPNGIPVNPRNGQRSIRILGEGESFEAVVDKLYGWVYDPRTGEVRPHTLPFEHSPTRRRPTSSAARIDAR
jgi:hypothetical protein